MLDGLDHMNLKGSPIESLEVGHAAFMQVKQHMGFGTYQKIMECGLRNVGTQEQCTPQVNAGKATDSGKHD